MILYRRFIHGVVFTFEYIYHIRMDLVVDCRKEEIIDILQSDSIHDC
jgi:hypothetical protein